MKGIIKNNNLIFIDDSAEDAYDDFGQTHSDPWQLYHPETCHEGKVITYEVDDETLRRSPEFTVRLLVKKSTHEQLLKQKTRFIKKS